MGKQLCGLVNGGGPQKKSLAGFGPSDSRGLCSSASHPSNLPPYFRTRVRVATLARESDPPSFGRLYRRISQSSHRDLCNGWYWVMEFGLRREMRCNGCRRPKKSDRHFVRANDTIRSLRGHVRVSSTIPGKRRHPSPMTRRAHIYHVICPACTPLVHHLIPTLIILEPRFFTPLKRSSVWVMGDNWPTSGPMYHVVRGCSYVWW